MLCGCVVLVFWARTSNANAHPISDAQIEDSVIHATKLYEEGKLAEALAAFEALEIPAYLTKRRAQKYHNIGITLLRLGRMAEAAEALQEAVRYDPNNVAAERLLNKISGEE